MPVPGDDSTPAIPVPAGTTGAVGPLAPAGGGTGTAGADPLAAPAAAAPPDLGRPTVFVLLRHGETALTGERRYSGSGGGDPELAPAGREQAARAARALAGRTDTERPDAVVSSPLARCRQTAEPAAALLGVPVAVEEGLRETDFGAWDGLTFAEARRADPAAHDAWLASPDAAPPGGESLAAVADRVAAARDRLLAAHRGHTVLLVSHVTPIKTLVRLALGAPHEALHRFHLPPASLTEIAYYADGNATVRYVNRLAAEGT